MGSLCVDGVNYVCIMFCELCVKYLCLIGLVV